MNKVNSYKQECSNLISMLDKLSGVEKYRFAQGLEGATTTAAGIVAAGQDLRYDNDFQRVLTTATDVVLEFEKDNPEFD